MVKDIYKRIAFYVKAYRRLELMNRAAGLSFYTIVSIFPLILVVTTVLSLLAPADTWQLQLKALIQDTLPFESQLLMTNIDALFSKKLTLSWIGILGLFISSQMLYVNLERIINSILHTQANRNFVITRLFFFVWLIGMVMILFAPVIVGLVAQIFASLSIDVAAITRFSGHISFLLSGFFMFCLILFVLPTRRLRFTRVLSGGILFAITLQIGKVIFKAISFQSVSRYNLVYGSLSSTMLVMFWIFYFYNMFLFFVYWAGRKNDPHYLRTKKQPDA